MEILLSFIVFLLGMGVGILALDYLHRGRDANRAIEVAERLAQERTAHTNATATVLLKETRLFAQAILKELQAAADERKALLDLVMNPNPGAPDSGEPFACAPESEADPVAPGACTLSPDAPTPPSGYCVTDLLGIREDRRR